MRIDRSNGMSANFISCHVFNTIYCRVKDQKIGEGTYAVVYRGTLFCSVLPRNNSFIVNIGRELSTGRKIAIKKIKIGQFKDGLDMSAIREVKYLRELKHQNVIEVSFPYCPLLIFQAQYRSSEAFGRLFFENEPQSRA